jgi:hypothetical protein
MAFKRPSVRFRLGPPFEIPVRDYNRGLFFLFGSGNQEVTWG